MDKAKNTFGVILLVIIILLFSVGGYFLMDYMIHREKNIKTDAPDEVVEMRLDTSKDYIYFSEEVELIASEELVKQDAFINVVGMESINETLKNELEELSNNIKYTKDMDITITDDYMVNEEGIYSLDYRDYENAKYGTYVSLVVFDYSYDIAQGALPTNIKSYVVNYESGHLLTEDEILNKYEADMDTVKESIRQRLENTQVLVGDQEVININETLNDLNYALSISKLGKLKVSFVVKSSQNNYNDSIEI